MGRIDGECSSVTDLGFDEVPQVLHRHAATVIRLGHLWIEGQCPPIACLRVSQPTASLECGGQSKVIGGIAIVEANCLANQFDGSLIASGPMRDGPQEVPGICVRWICGDYL